MCKMDISYSASLLQSNNRCAKLEFCFNYFITSCHCDLSLNLLEVRYASSYIRELFSHSYRTQETDSYSQCEVYIWVKQKQEHSQSGTGYQSFMRGKSLTLFFITDLFRSGSSIGRSRRGSRTESLCEVVLPS